MRLIFTLGILFWNSVLFANIDTTLQKSNINKVELFIIQKAKDSALTYLKKVKDEKKQTQFNVILNSKELSNKEYYYFLEDCFKNRNISDVEFSKYIEENIEEPEKDVIDLDYVRIKWLQVSKVRDEGDLDESSRINDKLLSYINQFNEKSIHYELAKVYANVHKIVLSYIQKDIESTNSLINKNLESAEQYRDVLAQINTLSLLCDVYVIEGKLIKFIETAEKALLLEKELERKSIFYTGNIIHLIDGYAFKGGEDNRVRELLMKLYNDDETRIESHSLFANYLSRLPKNDLYKTKIYNLLNKDNALDYCNEIIKQTETLLNKNEFFFVLSSASLLLEKEGFLKEALVLSRRCVELNQSIYSEDLASSLASSEVKEEVRIKEQEIAYQKKQSKLYLISGSLFAIALFGAVFFLITSRRQSSKLNEQNRIIQKAYEEKDLLIKEVHHRVKNNFQIVSSLLELQSKGIEDEKALALANEGKNRVKSMALIHQKLYQNESGLINFDEYIKLLVNEISAMYAGQNNVQTNINAENIKLDVDTAIPLGLIINEIITNSYKYAFAKAEKNILNVSINKEYEKGNYRLEISDNGPGIDNNIDVKTAKSLGLRLITRLVKQLQGKMKITSQGGAQFDILFKDVMARNTID